MTRIASFLRTEARAGARKYSPEITGNTVGDSSIFASAGSDGADDSLLLFR